MNRKGIVGAMMLSLLLAACRDNVPAPVNNGGGGGNLATYTKFGYVTVASTRANGQTSVGASAFFSSAPAMSTIPSAPTGGADTCFVFKADSSQSNPLANPLLGTSSTSIDAGDPIVIKSGATTYATLARLTSATNPFAYSSVLSSSTPTANLTVSISGAANGFPSFSNVAFPSTLPTPLTLTAPTNTAAVTTDTTFSWSGASNDANSFVLLVNLQFLSLQEVIYAVCNARDDGSFTFPDTTKTAMTAQGWTTGSLFIASRSITKTVTQGDAALVLAINDGEAYPLTSLPGLPSLGMTSR